MKGGVIWAGEDEKCKRRGRAGTAVLVLLRVERCRWARMTGVVWVTGKTGISKNVWVSAYAPVKEQ